MPARCVASIWSGRAEAVNATIGTSQTGGGIARMRRVASMLVTFDPKNNQLVLQRVGGFQEGADKSLQLWALPPAGGPRSLGVLGQDKLLKLVAGEADVRQVPALAISLEPKGGVPSERGPTGPVLFKGELIQRML